MSTLCVIAVFQKRYGVIDPTFPSVNVAFSSVFALLRTIKSVSVMHVLKTALWRYEGPPRHPFHADPVQEIPKFHGDPSLK